MSENDLTQQLQIQPQLEHLTDAFLDLIESCEIKSIETLEQWSTFDLCAYMRSLNLNVVIIDRVKGSYMTGQLFYQMGTKIPAPNERPKWWFFSKYVTDYNDISKLSSIITEYQKV